MAELCAGEGGSNSACAAGGVAMTSVCAKGAEENARKGGVITGRGQEGRGRGEGDEGGSHGTNGKWRKRERGDGRSKVGGDGQWGEQMATVGKGGGTTGRGRGRAVWRGEGGMGVRAAEERGG